MYAGNPKLAALAVAGSVGAGVADEFSDLELDCYWLDGPDDLDRAGPVRALGGELTALWDYDEDEEEWSEDYRLGELDVTVSNFLASTIDRFVDDVTLRADTDPVKHMRLAALQRSRVLVGAELMASWRARADGFPDRLELLTARPPEQALRVAEALLADTTLLAATHTDADLSAFRATLSERRQPITPPDLR